MIKKIFIGLGIIVITGISVLAFREFVHKNPIPDIIELPSQYRKITNEGSSITQSTTTKYQDEQSTSVKESTKKEPLVRLLINAPFGFAEIDYPNLYGYDYTNKSVKIFNLKDKTYKDLYSNSSIDFVALSPLKRFLVFRERDSNFPVFYLLDLKKDKIYPLDIFIKKIIWEKNDELVYYFSNNSMVNYIGKIQFDISGLKNIKIIDTGALNPEFKFFSNKILLASEKNSPLFLIDSKTTERKILLSEKKYVSFLSNEKLIFASYVDQNWKSAIINASGQIIKSFNWGTFKEKCLFSSTSQKTEKNILVCGVPKIQSAVGLPDNWFDLRQNFEDKIIIIDTNKINEIKEIDIGDNFDVLSPQLTPVGIIFTNRIDSKVYLVPIENFSL